MEQKELLKLNLQHFATPEDGTETPEGDNQDGTGNPEGDNPDGTEPTDEEKETYTKAELDKLTSERVDKAIKTREAKMNEEFKAKEEQIKADAIEYQKLTDKEKLDKDLEKKMSDLEAREQAINNRELISQIEADLKDNDLPASFADTLLGLQDNEKIKSAIGAIKEDYDNAINQQVKEALRQKTPEDSTSDGTLSPFDAKLKKYP